MSSIFGVFGKLVHVLTGFRKKKTTIETLEHLEKEIKECEKFKQKSEYNEKKYIGALLLYSIVFYVIGAVFYYIYLMPKNLGDRVKTLIPFFIMPLLIFLLRKFLKWFYIKRQTTYENKLNYLKEEKKCILEEVKEKETYKKAREILERFSLNGDVQITPPTTPAGNTSMFPNSTPALNNTKRMQINETAMLNSSNMINANNTLIHRNVKQLQQQNQSYNTSKASNSAVNNLDQTKSQTNQLNSSTVSNVSNIQSSGSVITGNNNQQAPTTNISQARTLLPRPIIAPNRTIFDKLLDFLIGEGPNNRYALICKSCHFHNGMALKEEFEYVAFRCAYCLFYNESRKNKLVVPNKKLGSIADTNMNHSTTSTSNLSSAESFDEGGQNEPISEPIISAATMQSKFQKNLLSSSSQKSLDKLNLNNEIIMRRKGSLTDSSNNLKNRIEKGTTRSMERLNNIERMNRDGNNKENFEENMDFELIPNTKKNE